MKIGGIIEQLNLALYTIASIPDKPGSAAQVLQSFANERINLAYITEGVDKDGNVVLSFCVDCDDVDKVDNLIKTETEIQNEYIAKQDYVAMLGIYGPHFREKPAIAVRFFDTLGKAGINILGISSSISTISCIVKLKELDKAKEALLSYFELP
jgi:aspartokinase